MALRQNDPAFLFYSKDWIQGTAQMTPDEKGVYIDLLAHQHQENGLPTTTKRLARMVHLPEEEFLKIWDFLKGKFTEQDGKLFNKKLDLVMNGRVKFTGMRRIIGTFGRLLSVMELSEEAKQILKKSFKYQDFEQEFEQNEQNLSKTISNWIALCLARPKQSVENGNANGNYKDRIGGAGGREDDFACDNAEEFILRNQIAFEKICIATMKGADVVKKELHAYHLWLAKNLKYPSTEKAVTAGIESWILNGHRFKAKFNIQEEISQNIPHNLKRL